MSKPALRGNDPLFRAPVLSVAEKTTIEARKIIDEQRKHRDQLTAALRAARLARDAAQEPPAMRAEPKTSARRTRKRNETEHTPQGD
ncbi:MAG: hypothetical protein QM682_02275 [Paracoccus sp. (in: a-proteobacteria)]|uniref:hypothetical protein n=1 Tax=Paracoccus sp. TaxID=267 RepID=UPI0039E31DCB